MFGYHAAHVVYLASLIHRAGGPRLANPFAHLVTAARERYCRACGDMRQPDHRCTSESLTWPTHLLELATHQRPPTSDQATT